MLKLFRKWYWKNRNMEMAVDGVRDVRCYIFKDGRWVREKWWRRAWKLLTGEYSW